jgi:putative endonuclease
MINTIVKPQYYTHLKRSYTKDQKAEHFYTYILKLSDNSYYIGFTRDLRERIIEHKDGYTISTKGKNPQLKYFETFNSRPEAEKREKQLQFTNKHNHRELLRIINNFQDLIDLLQPD